MFIYMYVLYVCMSVCMSFRYKVPAVFPLENYKPLRNILKKTKIKKRQRQQKLLVGIRFSGQRQLHKGLEDEKKLSCLRQIHQSN